MFIPDPGSWFLSIPDPGSRIPDLGSRIPDPGSRIPDLKTATKERGERICCPTFFCSHKNHKTENYINFELVKRKIWANLQRIIELSTQKIVTKLSKIWVWDPRPGIRKKPIPDPGVKKAPDHGSRIRIRNTEVNYLISFPAGPSSRAIQVIEASEEQHLSMYSNTASMFVGGVTVYHCALLTEYCIRMFSLDFFFS